jgi:uncharacterized membrane protein YhhN
LIENHLRKIRILTCYIQYTYNNKSLKGVLPMQAFIIAMFGIFLMIFILMPCYLSLKRRGRNKKLSLFVKGATTFVAVILSYWGYWKAMTSQITYHLPSSFFSRSVLIGLTICLFADVLLGIQVYIGGILFFLGHIAYIVYFIELGGFPIICIPMISIFTGIALCYFYRFSVRLGKEKYFYFLYGLTIFTTLSLGLTLPVTIGIWGFPIALASVLIVVSDVLLARNTLYKETSLSDTVALLYYFSGQLLLALTIYLSSHYAF